MLSYAINDYLFIDAQPVGNLRMNRGKRVDLCAEALLFSKPVDEATHLYSVLPRVIPMFIPSIFVQFSSVIGRVIPAIHSPYNKGNLNINYLITI
jgi:hypothetical protein